MAADLEHRFAAIAVTRKVPWPRRLASLRRFRRWRLEKARAAIMRSGLFDAAWYLRRHADLATHPDLIRHYLEDGAREGRDPSPLFDSDWYLARNPDVAEQQINPLLHFILFGARERRDPHPLFRTSFYLAALDHSTLPANALAHYLTDGPQSRLSPHPLFDPEWYAEASGHVTAREEQDPLLVQYLTVGEELDVAPHPLFRPEFVRQQMRMTTESPLARYAQSGAAAALDPHPLFNTEWFLRELGGRAAEKLPDEVTPLEFYLAHGGSVSPHPLFDPEWYRTSVEDLDGSAPLVDYVVNGGKAGCSSHWLIDTEHYLSKLGAPLRHNLLEDYLARAADGAPDPGPWFDTQWYVSQIGEETYGVSPLEHYVRYGLPNGTPPHPRWTGSAFELRSVRELCAIRKAGKNDA
jgi:hypothetical protein